MTRTVGVIGAGTMGSAMAKNLVTAGFRVIGRDTSPEREAALAALRAEIAASPRAVADTAEVIITSLPSITAFDEVVGGPDGIAASGKDGLIVCETSTLPIEVKDRGRAQLAESGVVLLDTPLSGTGAQAAVKDLVIYASGETDAIARCTDVFNSIGRAHFDIGAFGNGSRMKFVANLLVAIHNVASAEAVVLGIKAGLDPQAIYDVIAAGAGTSRIFEIRGPMMVADNYEPATMSLELWQKDMQIIGEFAAGLGCTLPLFEASEQVYRDALEMGLQAKDTAAVCTVLESLAGIKR